MKKVSKKVLVVASLVAIVLTAVLLSSGWVAGTSPQYYALYLRTGDLYFGHLVRFPHYGLKNVYTIQVNQQNAQNPLSIRKFTSIFWGPEDYLRINPDDVVWSAALSGNSQLVQLLKNNPELLPTAGAPQGQTGLNPSNGATGQSGSGNK
jgi:hypothetical protein